MDRQEDLTLILASQISERDPADRHVLIVFSDMTGATQSSTATGCWGQTFGSSGVPDDRWSNLTQITVTQCTAGMLNVSAPSNNQLSSGTMAYDGVGNMTGDGAGDTFAFDAENHITTASGTMVTGGTWYYTYDGNGIRVAKCDNRSSAPCTGAAGGSLYWRDINGNVLSESDLSGNITNDYIYFAGRKAAQEDASGNIHYLYPDQVNSTVMMTDSSGNSCYNATFTPYGEEHSTLNTCSTNYKFTGYERDSETGLDYAFARYYSSRLGRFMSADPLAGTTSNPQSLNRYSYVQNHPINSTDSSGMHDDNCEVNGADSYCGLLWGLTGIGGDGSSAVLPPGVDLEGQGDIDGLIFNLEFSSDDPAGGFSLTYLDPLGAELAGAPAIEVFPNAILSLPLPDPTGSGGGGADQQKCAKQLASKLSSQTGLSSVAAINSTSVIYSGGWVNFSGSISADSDYSAEAAVLGLTSITGQPSFGLSIFDGIYSNTSPSLHVSFGDIVQPGVVPINVHVDAFPYLSGTMWQHTANDWLPSNGIGAHATPCSLLARL